MTQERKRFGKHQTPRGEPLLVAWPDRQRRATWHQCNQHNGKCSTAIHQSLEQTAAPRIHPNQWTKSNCEAPFVQKTKSSGPGRQGCQCGARHKHRSNAGKACAQPLRVEHRDIIHARNGTGALKFLCGTASLTKETFGQIM